MKILMFAAAIAVFLIPCSVIAQNDTFGIGSTEDRLNQALNSTKLKLDDEAKQSITSKCKNSQIIIRELQLEADKSVRLRLKIYNSINADLQAIKLRMLRQGSDASETDLLSGKLQQMIDHYTLDSDKYGTTLDDLVTVNCSEKPELFMAGLLLARTQRAKIYIEVSDIKSTLRNSEKNIFSQLKKRLML